MIYSGMNRDGEIVNICGHKWRIVDIRFTLPGPTYKMQDVINAGGHIPQIARFATNSESEK